MGYTIKGVLVRMKVCGEQRLLQVTGFMLQGNTI